MEKIAELLTEFNKAKKKPENKEHAATLDKNVKFKAALKTLTTYVNEKTAGDVTAVESKGHITQLETARMALRSVFTPAQDMSKAIMNLGTAIETEKRWLSGLKAPPPVDQTDETAGDLASRGTTEEQLKFLKEYKGSVMLKLLDKLHPAKMSADALGAQLLKNFKAVGFKYTMKPGSGAALVKGRLDGDCKMLADAFVLVMREYCGIDGKTEGKRESFTTPKSTTIDGKTGNCDGGERWVFDNHYWANVGGKNYDVLFCRILTKSGWVDQSSPDEVVSGVNRATYGALTVWGPYSGATFEEKFSTGDEPKSK